MISLKTVWLVFLMAGSCVATGIYFQVEDLPQIVQSITEAIPDEVLQPTPELLDDPPEKQPEILPETPEQPPDLETEPECPEFEEIEYPEGGYDPPGGGATKCAGEVGHA